jgi:uncharacterized protein YndB with AHSA1/START domain
LHLPYDQIPLGRHLQILLTQETVTAMDLAEDYRRWWPTVERSNAWLVADGNRRIRFRGAEENRLGHSLRIAAINLRRLVNSDWTPTEDGGSGQSEIRRASPGRQKRDRSLGSAHLGGRLQPFCVGASVGHIAGLR